MIRNPFFLLLHLCSFCVFLFVFFITKTNLGAIEDQEFKATWNPLPKPLVFSSNTLYCPGLEPGTMWALVPKEGKNTKPALKLRLTPNGPQIVRAIAPGPLQLAKFKPINSAQPLIPPMLVDLDDTPEFIMEHPTGILVFCNGDLVRFRLGKHDQAPCIKEILIKRLDTYQERSVGRIFLDMNGSIRLALSPGKAWLVALDGSGIKQRGNALLLKLEANGSDLEILNDLGKDPFGPGLVWNVFGEPFLAAPQPRGTSTQDIHAKPTTLAPLYPGMSPTGQNLPNQTIFTIWDNHSQPESGYPPTLIGQTDKGDWVLYPLERDGELLRPAGNIQKFGATGPGSIFLGGGTPGTWIIGRQNRSGEKAFSTSLSGFATMGNFSIPKGENKHPEVVQIANLSPPELAKAFAGISPFTTWSLWAQIRERIDRQKIINPDQTPPIVVALLEALKDNTLEETWDDRRKVLFLSCLGASGDKDSIALIRDWAETASPVPRSYAFSLLKKFIHPDDNTGFQIFLNGLSDSDLRVKCSALRGLGTIPFPGSANTLISAYSFDSGQSPQWTSALISAISDLGHKKQSTYGQILEMAESGNPGHLKKAIDLFAVSEDSGAFGSILNLLNYPHLTPKDQAILLRAVQLGTDKNKAEKLLTWIKEQDDPSIEVAQIGLEKLESTKVFGESEVFGFLKRLLESSDPEKRWVALAIFKKQKYQGGEDWLKKFPRDEKLTPVQMRAFEEALQNQKAIREGVTPP